MGSDNLASWRREREKKETAGGDNSGTSGGARRGRELTGEKKKDK